MSKKSARHTTSAIGGYMLIQLVIGIVIIIILASITVLNLSGYAEVQALNNGIDEVTALINEAHTRTISADSGTTYGVHLEANDAVLFPGTTYTPGAIGNKIVTFDSRIEIDAISLTGGGSTILFDALTGDTADYGTFEVRRISTSTGAKTLTVSKTGVTSSN